jgi:hypothetical protein
MKKISILYEFLQELEVERNLSNLFYEAKHYSDIKSRKRQCEQEKL